MSITNQDIALSIINHFTTVISNKELQSEDAVDSLNAAIDCIAEAFGVDSDAATKISAKFNNKSLKQLLEAGVSSATAAEVPVHIDAQDEQTKAKAEALKLEGNRGIAEKNFELAVEKYTEAIALVPGNPIYYSNRAAAYTSLKDFQNAIKDAEKALEIDPSYAKGYSRLGLAKFAIGEFTDALEAYKKGLEAEGANKSQAMLNGYETAKKKVEESLGGDALEKAAPAAEEPKAAPGGLPDFGNLASMLGGGGEGLAGLMNNPQVMQAAQKLMSNPGALDNIMNNPAMQKMAAGFQNGQMPDMSEMMNDPAIREMARNFMGGN